jgi:hypothetical protein
MERSGADTSLIECQTQATYSKIYYFFLVVLKITLSDTPSCTGYSGTPYINLPYTYVNIKYVQSTLDFVCADYMVCSSSIHDGKLPMTNEECRNNVISRRVLEQNTLNKKIHWLFTYRISVSYVHTFYLINKQTNNFFYLWTNKICMFWITSVYKSPVGSLPNVTLDNRVYTYGYSVSASLKSHSFFFIKIIINLLAPEFDI